jgi:hypothetical protein
MYLAIKPYRIYLLALSMSVAGLYLYVDWIQSTLPFFVS